MKKKILAAFLMMSTVLASASLCYAEDTTDLNAASLDEIIANAKEEGSVESVGMPDTWANWGLSWTALEQEYGISHADARTVLIIRNAASIFFFMFYFPPHISSFLGTSIRNSRSCV